MLSWHIECTCVFVWNVSKVLSFSSDGRNWLGLRKRHLKCWGFFPKEKRRFAKLDEVIWSIKSDVLPQDASVGKAHDAPGQFINDFQGAVRKEFFPNPGSDCLTLGRMKLMYFRCQQACWLLIIISYPAPGIWLSLTPAAADPTR